MHNALGLTEFGFWMAAAIVVVAFVWAGVKKRQMKHELTLKLLEKGQGMDPELLERLLASDKPGASAQPKSAAERRRDDSRGFVAAFFMGGLMLAFMGIVMRGHSMEPIAGAAGQGPVPLMRWVDTGPSWPIIGLGAFCFVLGCFSWFRANRQYKRDKAEEKLSQD